MYRVSDFIQADFGATYKYIRPDLDYTFDRMYDSHYDYNKPGIEVKLNDANYKTDNYLSITVQPLERLAFTCGIRHDYYSYNGNDHFSPRFSGSFGISEKTVISSGFGVYYQNLPLIYLSQSEDYKDLNDLKSNHFTLGLTHELSDKSGLSIEYYKKEYSNMPINPFEYSLFLLDELLTCYGTFSFHRDILDIGKAYTNGIEMVFQKEISDHLNIFLGGSYFRARYRGFDNIWRDRSTENRIVFSTECNYRWKPDYKINVRWNYAEGHPYTPYDTTASIIRNQGIHDVEKINTARLPDYHVLSIRFDKNFHFKHSSLKTYILIWNVYNRNNILGYTWGETENKTGELKQLCFLPVFGLEYQF